MSSKRVGSSLSQPRGNHLKANTPDVRRRLAGWILSTLAVAFLLFDGLSKALTVSSSVETTIDLGYPEWLVVWIGVLLLCCLALYVVSRTAVLGAILLTGYLGGATATQVRLEGPWFALPVALGVMLWIGLYLRDERLQELLPLR